MLENFIDHKIENVHQIRGGVFDVHNDECYGNRVP